MKFYFGIFSKINYQVHPFKNYKLSGYTILFFYNFQRPYSLHHF